MTNSPSHSPSPHVEVLKLFWRICRFMFFLPCYRRSVSLGHIFFFVENGVISDFFIATKVSHDLYIQSPNRGHLPPDNLPSLNLLKMLAPDGYCNTLYRGGVMHHKRKMF